MKKLSPAELDRIRKADSAQLAAEYVKQLFDMEAKTIRDKAAQQAYLRSHTGKKAKVDKAKAPRLRVDPELMVVHVDNKTVKVAALADAVAKLAEDRPEVKTIFWKAFRAGAVA